MKIIICIFLSFFMLTGVMADVTLPTVVSDNMVLQRDLPVKLWGKAGSGEAVSVSFNGQTVKTKAGKDGTWRVQIKAMPYGGPYDMTIKGKNTITLRNILIGDVWICSGQSNMEWVVANSNHAKEEIANAQYPKIRLLTVKKSMSNVPLQDADTQGWVECSPQTIERFSAVGYFFGRELYRQTDIPIGLVNTSWGGTVVETWTSIPMMRTRPEYAKRLDALQSPSFARKLEKPDVESLLKTEPGASQNWYLAGTDFSQWKTVSLPARWSAQGISGVGVAWYQKEFILTAGQAKGSLTVCLGSVDDRDETYLNGRKIGATTANGIQRQYTVCADGLREGKNTLVVRVVNTAGDGGMYDNADRMYCQTSDGRIPLTGEWRCKLSSMIEASDILGPNDYPSLLYNAMIAPLIPFPIKGAIWYQGESNTPEAYKYRTLFPNMITDWRKAWAQGDFPFYFVQLANFTAPVAEPGESDWAELRESQHLTLKLPDTGEAVTIDIGDAVDIHPRNKQDVGYRLALNALAKTYGKQVEYSGPEYQSMKTDGNRIILTFTHDKGLFAKNKYGYLSGFSIAGDDRKFVWANARIEGNTVVVYSDKVSRPVAVRYAWATNPDDANLYNSDGLPASPFRTDDWKISTQK